MVATALARPAIAEEGQAIVGGVSTAEGDFPATGMLLKGRHYRCTATLIQPDVVLTAAHCLVDTGFGDFSFSLDRDLSDLEAANPVPVIAYHRHPGYRDQDKPTDIGQVNDVAVAILEWPIEGVPVEQLYTPNLPADLAAGSELGLCGYGITEWYERSSVGVQRTARVMIDRMADFEMRIGASDPQPCLGDSGAPLFVDTAAGRRIAGVVVRAVGETLHCDNGAIATRIEPYNQWIQRASLDHDMGCAAAGRTGSPFAGSLLALVALWRARRRA
jgi:secreted trypsin-like serine protease